MPAAVPPSRPKSAVPPIRGAVDLGVLAAQREAQRAAAQRAAGPGHGQPGPGQSGLVIDVTQATFQTEVLERSNTVPVVIDLWADWCGPCKQLTPVLERLIEEYAGRLVLAKIDTDAEQALAAAFGVQSIPTIVAVLKGQPVPLFQGALPERQVRQYFEELLKVAAANGVSGTVAASTDAAGEDSASQPSEPEPGYDPRLDAAVAAIEAGDWAAAEAEYRAMLTANPADPDANAGLAQVALLQRTEGIDPDIALADGSAQHAPAAAVMTAADMAVLMGDPETGFGLLIGLVKRTTGDERTAARDRLLELFTVVDPQDPRVIKARAALASALF